MPEAAALKYRLYEKGIIMKHDTEFITDGKNGIIKIDGQVICGVKITDWELSAVNLLINDKGDK
jgi:hypothetical protein